MRRMLRKLRTALTGRGTMGVASPASAAPAGLTEILETLDDGLLVTDLSLTIVQWNAAMERLSGLPRASAIGRNADRLLPLFDAIGLPRYLRQAVGGEARFSAEAPGHDGAATIRIEARCVPLTDRYGHVAGVAAFLVDATERQRRAVFARAMETIGRSLASSLDLNEVLDTIANTAMEVMAAQSALVASGDGKAREFRVLRAVGRLSAEYANRGSIPSAGGRDGAAVGVLGAQPSYGAEHSEFASLPVPGRHQRRLRCHHLHRGVRDRVEHLVEIERGGERPADRLHRAREDGTTLSFRRIHEKCRHAGDVTVTIGERDAARLDPDGRRAVVARRLRAEARLAADGLAQVPGQPDRVEERKETIGVTPDRRGARQSGQTLHGRVPLHDRE